MRSNVAAINGGTAKGLRALLKFRWYYYMMVPGLVYYFLFEYLPMYGIVIAFQDFSLGKGILGSTWVGIKHFAKFFSLPNAWPIIRNTILINVYELAFSFPAPIVLALLFTELKSDRYRRIAQTISYLPHFISSVIVIGMVVNFLSPSSGVINHILVRVLGFKEPIFFLSKPEWFRPVFIATGIWQGVGWGTILYLAAIAGVNPELYEAAEIDGANRFQKILYVTLPAMFPVIVTLFVLNLGGMLSVGAQRIILMYNPLIYETADVINTYVYRRGILGADFSFATAVGLFQSVIGLILVVGANKIARTVSETSLW